VRKKSKKGKNLIKRPVKKNAMMESTRFGGIGKIGGTNHRKTSKGDNLKARTILMRGGGTRKAK